MKKFEALKRGVAEVLLFLEALTVTLLKLTFVFIPKNDDLVYSNFIYLDKKMRCNLIFFLENFSLIARNPKFGRIFTIFTRTKKRSPR